MTETFDIVRVVRGDITGAGPLHVFPVAVRSARSRRKRRQDVVHASIRQVRSRRREMHPNREMRSNAAWCRRAWLHAKSGQPSSCSCGAMPLATTETCPFCGVPRL